MANEQFDKYSVLKAITDASKTIPTPTDSEHPAHWWNEEFGRKIKNEMVKHFARLFDRIERMVDL